MLAEVDREEPLMSPSLRTQQLSGEVIMLVCYDVVCFKGSKTVESVDPFVKLLRFLFGLAFLCWRIFLLDSCNIASISSCLSLIVYKDGVFSIVIYSGVSAPFKELQGRHEKWRKGWGNK